MLVEPQIEVICEPDIGLRVIRRLCVADDGEEFYDSGVNIEETRGEEVVKSVWVGNTEIPKLIKALQELS